MTLARWGLARFDSGRGYYRPNRAGSRERERERIMGFVPCNDCLDTVGCVVPSCPVNRTCRYCSRTIRFHGGEWIDPHATGDDSVWRETCEGNDTFPAAHEPNDGAATDKYVVHPGTGTVLRADKYVWEWVEGVSVSSLTTGQIWDASCWTRKDWEEFCDPDFDKLSVLETMTEYARWEDLRDATRYRQGEE